MPKQERVEPNQKKASNLFNGLILAISGVLAFAALVLPVAIRPSVFPLKVGDVSSQDIQAPYALSYQSEELTLQAREEAAARIAPVYLPADPTINRRQLEKLRVALNYISVVRQDAFATQDQKIDDLLLLNDLTLEREYCLQLLSLSDNRWQNVQQEVLRLIEQVMRNSLRETDILSAQRALPTLVSFSLSQDLSELTVALVSPFIVPNSLYSDDQTSSAREQAREAVQPVMKSYVDGEAIVRRGQVVLAAQWEALQQYGLIQPAQDNLELLSSLSLVVAMAAFVSFFFTRRKNSVLQKRRSVLLIAVVFLAFLFVARFTIVNRTVLPYLFPLPAFALTIACLFNLEMGLILSLVLSILSAFNLPNSLDLTFYYILSSLCGVLILGKGMRISSFFWSGIGIGALGSAMILAYRLTSLTTDLVGIATLIGASFLCGMIAASLTLILQYLFSQLLGVTTALQLLEISRPDHPLLQFILQNAPGSYQHSLQVAILAEQAAEKIGADPLLVRVGAMYHDAGKADNPTFFIENQVYGKLNPHDDLDPVESAQTIIRHVEDGANLARKYRLPARIQDFMFEHHGTMITRYQYARALQLAENNSQQVDKELFRYPGPTPRTPETALLMLADGCQARARAESPQNEAEIRALVRKVIDACQREGQLDNTNLTLRDLNVITESFVHTLQNTYHPRIRYPEIKATPTLPSLPSGEGAIPEKTEP